jgi:FSR family fosmidomycin resistance protein-like MFS transporter
MADQPQSTSWALFVCTITHTFVHVFTAMHTALIPVFMTEFGLSIIESGLLVSIPLVLSVSFSVPYGLLMDRVNPRNLMIVSLLMTGVSGFAVSQASDFYTLLFPLMFIPLSSTIYHPPALSIVSDLFPQRNRSRALGIHGAGGTSGVAIGPLTLGLVISSFGWRIAYLAWVLPVILSSLFLLKLPRSPALVSNESPQPKQTLTENEKAIARRLRYGYVLLLLAISISGIGGQSVSTYMTTYLVSNRGLAESTASLIYGLNSAVGILGSLSGGYLASSIGNKRWMMIAYLASATISLGIWLGPLWSLAIIYLAGGFFGGSNMGPSTSLAAEFSSRERRGRAYTFFMLPLSLIGAAAPIIAAQIIELYEIQVLFPFSVCLALISVVVLSRLPDGRHA